MSEDKDQSKEISSPKASADSAESGGQTVAAMLGKFGTVAVGLVLLMFGLSMVIPQGGTGNSGMERALGALVTALGGGIIATVLLPHSLELDGEQVKPFGVDLKASGGAAVFVLSLLFAYFGAQVFGDKPSPQPEPTPTPSPQPDPGPTEEPGPLPEPTDEAEIEPEPGPGPEPAPTPLPEEPNISETAINYQTLFGLPPVASEYRYGTYCPIQCPGGPAGCPSTAWGQHPQRIPAQEVAVNFCISAGGDPACCADNLVEF